MKVSDLTQTDGVLVVLAIWVLALTAVYYAPITGFWWNLLVFIGAYEVAKVVVLFLVVLLYGIFVQSKE